MMAKWTEKLEKLNFDKKMRLFISISIILTATIIMILSAISANNSLMKKSRSLVQIQINTRSDNLQMNLENYYNIAVTLMMDNTVQKYLKSTGEEEDYHSVVNNMRNNLNGMINMQSHINFISIIKNNDEDYLYKGSSSLAQSKFVEQYPIDYANSELTGYGTMRMSINDAYFEFDKYSVTLYQPIYDNNKVGKVIGRLCISIDEKGLLKFENDRQSGSVELEESLINFDGTIVYNLNHEQIGKKINYNNKIVGSGGSFQLDNYLYIYKKIGQWNYYLINAISMNELTQDSINTMFLLIFAILIMVIISLFIGSQIIKKMYHPLNELVGKMSGVSKGYLDVRMNEEKMGNDFLIIANSFNVMMDRLNALVEQVKEEQHQVEQIRFNALQSQIKPHFLYNTLECIHWQVMMDGNKTASKLVKALATYYRLCLSNGKDVITLLEEIKHAKSYLTIQNMRYDDIIKSEIYIDEAFYNVQIPKISLQPLIENAIYHGIKIKEGKKGVIKISAFEQNDCVIIQVSDSGKGMKQEEIDEINNSISIHDETFGYGVRNVNKRIEILFGETYGLYYQKNKEGGITVQISLPK